MASVEVTLRTLVLGLGECTQGNIGIGGRLTKSLSKAFRGVEVRCASEFVSLEPVLHDYDLVIVLNPITFCGKVGHVFLGSPASLANGWGVHPTHAETFSETLSYARLMGHRLPRIEVVNICVGSEDWPEAGLSPVVAAMYRGIVSRVRAFVKEVVREAQQTAASISA